MASDTMQPMPMSPRQSPAEFGSAAVQWACTRRGRIMVLTTLFLTILVGTMGMRNHETISSKYHDISTQYQWRPYLPHLPSIISSPFKTPSNLTLQLENGQLKHVPPKLKKTTPNFHLLMPSERDTDGFCKTTLSAMLLKYPPPTIVNLYTKYESDIQLEKDTLNSTMKYLSSEYVQDEDLVLIVDGEESWFQLPSDAIVILYKRLLEEANIRLLEKYGVNEEGYQRFNQTIVFGAEKMCQNDDMACKYVPQSVLPDDIYAKEMGRRIADMPAKFLNSKMLMGPANDLKVLYAAAIKKLEENKSQAQTVQSIMATLFGQQQMGRNEAEKEKKPATEKLKEILSGTKNKLAPQRRDDSPNVIHRNATKHEFSIGLDYTHTLFQPLIYCTEDELVPLVHDNSTDISKYNRPDSWTQYLSLPPALNEIDPPFWRPDLIKHNPSPNKKPAYIEKLEFATDLDKLPKRKTPWNQIELLQNTYTGTVPAVILNNPTGVANSNENHVPIANVTWFNMWYSPHRRALLRSYFRSTQSAVRYHEALVGGDRVWDRRGGRGGVWTAAELIWLPWGETDGVCGSVAQLKEVFGDGKGVWLHEKDENGEAERLKEELDLAKKIEEERKKTEEKEKQIKEQQEKDKKDKEEALRKEEEERKKKEEEERKKKEDEEKKNEDEDKKKKEQEEKEKADIARTVQDKVQAGEKFDGQKGSVFDTAKGAVQRRAQDAECGACVR